MGIVPTCLVEDELQAGTLVEPLKDRFDSPLGYYLCYPEARAHLGPLEKFRAWLLDECTAGAKPSKSDNPPKPLRPAP